MGFIEKEEEKSRERAEKTREDAERKRRINQENLDRLRLQKDIELEEKKRLYRLQREAEIQFNISGLKTMLSRLKEVGSIRSFSSKSDAEQVSENVDKEYGRDGTLPSEEVWPEGYWRKFENKDGSFHTKVIVSDENRNITRWKYVNTERFFHITTDSRGLITFEYGTRSVRYEKAQRSEWRKDPNLLEDLLEKAFNSPRTIKTKGEYPSFQVSSGESKA